MSRSTESPRELNVWAVRSCADLIALSEGYELNGRTRFIGGRSGEALVVRVRLTSDSALPDARIWGRAPAFSGGKTAHVSATGNRILSRVNQECRFARALQVPPVRVARGRSA
jgi:hypothetical protein